MNTPSTNSAYASEIGDQHLTMTPEARHKMSELSKTAEGRFEGIRVFVMGGGCSGMRYSMTFSNYNENIDRCYQGEDFKIFIDPVAFHYMEGAEIDYVDDGFSENFIFNNVFKSIGGSGACSGCAGAV